MNNEELLKEIESLLKEELSKNDDSEADEIKDSGSEPLLKKYDAEVRKQFQTELAESGRRGLDKVDIMKIFGVKETRANSIQKQLAADYKYIEYHSRRIKQGVDSAQETCLRGRNR